MAFPTVSLRLLLEQVTKGMATKLNPKYEMTANYINPRRNATDNTHVVQARSGSNKRI